MKKISIEKTNILLHDNMNKKKLSLDAEKMEPLKKNILKSLETIHKSLSDLDVILNKMALKKSFSDEYNIFAQQCAKKCVSQAQSVRTLIDNFEIKYNDDYKSILIQDLDDRISDIERRIAMM